MGGPAKFTDVRHPDTVQVIIHDAIEENARGLNPYSSEAPSRATPRPPAPSTMPPPPPAGGSRRHRPARAARGDAAAGHHHQGRVRRAEGQAARRCSARRQPGPVGHRDPAGLGYRTGRRSRGSASSPALRAVGGTKDPDIAAIVALAPDLVVVNDEENRREDADALGRGRARAARDPRALGRRRRALPRRPRGRRGRPGAPLRRPDPVRHPTGPTAWSASRRAFVPIWRRPWMTMNADTYGSSVLAALGVVNVFGDEAERYPTTTLADAAARQPDLVLAPTEPYPFKERHLHELRDGRGRRAPRRRSGPVLVGRPDAGGAGAARSGPRLVGREADEAPGRVALEPPHPHHGREVDRAVDVRELGDRAAWRWGGRRAPPSGPPSRGDRRRGRAPPARRPRRRRSCGRPAASGRRPPCSGRSPPTPATPASSSMPRQRTQSDSAEVQQDHVGVGAGEVRSASDEAQRGSGEAQRSPCRASHGQPAPGVCTSATRTCPVRDAAATDSSEFAAVSMNRSRRCGPPSMQAKHG